MPQALFANDDLRPCGLTPGDVRGGWHRELEVWRLPDNVAKLLRRHLVQASFDPAMPIHVHQSANPHGFVFTQ